VVERKKETKAERAVQENIEQGGQVRSVVYYTGYSDG